MDADDLLTVCFPDQVACAENLVGEREIPDHPLVRQTLDDATTEAMDGPGLVRLVERIERREVELVARDLTEPSPFAAGILTAKPYAFLDDAPLEERRTQAVLGRRWLDPARAKDLGALDQAAIARVCEDAWPDPRDADELVDMLGVLGYLSEAEGMRGGLAPLFTALTTGRRAARVEAAGGLWVAADRLAEVRSVHPGAAVSPELDLALGEPVPPDVALRELLRSRLEGVGPTTAAELAASLDVPEPDVEVALAALESEGVIFRGTFRSPPRAAVEWCERRLLARIHRMTIDRLRAEIEPVTQQDFVRFLFAWQRAGTERLEGPTGVRAALELLEGFEAPAGSWEADSLPVRVTHYDPAWLDGLCLSGTVSWLRRTPTESGSTPVRSTPIALVPRSAVERWSSLAPAGSGEAVSHAAAKVKTALERSGASFFDDVVSATGLLRIEVEEALGELVSRGLVGSDGFTGLRALLVPASRRRESEHGRRRGRGAVLGMESAGRWALFSAPSREEKASDEDVEAIARALLRRWGIVFRRVIDREGALPPWRDLLACYRRLEARGEIRGGRFVAGFTGEQYALPEAVTGLRAARKLPKNGTLFAVSAADPLNVVGVLTPGRRVAALAGNRVLYRDGVPVAAREGAETRLLVDATAVEEAELDAALIRRPLAPGVRAYLGSAGPNASLSRRARGAAGSVP